MPRPQSSLARLVIELLERRDLMNGDPVLTAFSDGPVLTYKNTPVLVDVLAYDQNPNGGNLQIVQVIPFGNASATVTEDNQVFVTPETDFVGDLTFAYVITNGNETSTATATVQVRRTPVELLDAYEQAVDDADLAYILALDGADEERDLIEEVAEGEYYGDADELYAVYESTVADAESAYQTAHAAADATYQDAIAQAQAALDARNEEAETDYYVALSLAEDAWNQAMQDATSAHDAAELAAQTAHADALAPYQASVAAAQTYADAHPEDPDAQAALAQAQQALADAELQANATRDTALAAALAAREAAEAQADLDYETASDAALTALNAELDAAQQEFEQAGLLAWESYQPLEDAALATRSQAEETAWNAYQAALGLAQSEQAADDSAAQALFTSAQESALLAWQQAEAAAWTTYSDEMFWHGGADPNLRRTAPPGWTDEQPAEEIPPPDESELPPGELPEEEWGSSDYTYDWPDETRPEEHELYTSAPVEPEQTITTSTSMAGSWWLEDSPYYARNLDQAKFRAWAYVSRTASDSTLIGQETADAFGVSAQMTWGEFFPWTEYERARTARLNQAQSLDLAILAALDADWQAYCPSSNDDSGLRTPVGDFVASRWSRVPGFEWVRPGTSWHELYTRPAYDRLRQMRSSAPLHTFLDNLYGSMDAFIGRLRYASSAEVSAFATQVKRNGSDWRTLSDRLSNRLADASETLASASASDEAKQRARETFNLCQALYSEIHAIGDASRYGVHDPNARTFGQLVASFRDRLSTSPHDQQWLNWENYRGTLAQRAALLADTTYEAFVARERLAQHLQFGPNGTPTRDIDISLGNMQNARAYYLNRDRLLTLHARILPNSSLTYIEYTGTLQDASSIASANQTLGAVYLHRGYLRGAAGNEHRLFSRDIEFYADDRYYLVTMGATLLNGWRSASAEDRNYLIDNLHPMERTALVNSLYVAEQDMLRAGAVPLATTAREMCDQIVRRFNEQLQSVEREPQSEQGRLIRRVYDWMIHGQGQFVRDGLSQMTPEERQAFNQMPASVRWYASAAAVQAFYEWRARNPFRVRYEPAFGLEFYDRFVINTAEMLSPVFRHAQRHVFRSVDEWGDLDAIRSIMSGNYNVQLGPTALSYNPLSMVGDNILTALTILPIGRISAGRHLILLLSGGASASFAMSAVEVAPIPPEWRGPLRLLAGLSAGVGGATLANLGLNSALRLARNSMVVYRTHELATARTELLDVEAQMRTAFTGTGSIPTSLARQHGDLKALIRRLEDQVARLRTLGGDMLRNAEARLADRISDLAATEAEAAAPGLSPSQRMARLNGDTVRRARQLVQEAQQAVAEQYNAVEQTVRGNAALRQALVDPQLDNNLLSALANSDDPLHGAAVLFARRYQEAGLSGVSS